PNFAWFVTSRFGHFIPNPNTFQNVLWIYPPPPQPTSENSMDTARKDAISFTFMMNTPFVFFIVVYCLVQKCF
ncbi:MAG: hypothetical protein LUF28_07635, partial [Clostridiales bacterium]|nr:hypothetical protein [Clostridiales bacterium]